MSLRKRSVRWRGSLVVKASSEVVGNADLLFLMPSRDGGAQRTLPVTDAEVKREVIINSEEVE